jgi:hypothetical protein
MPGPRKNLTPLDMKMMGLAFNQGGVINFLGKQPEVTAPVRAQSHADSPPVQLAYITDAEKDLLVKSNIHGSMDGKPNPGPAGLESLDDFFNIPGGGVGGGSTSNTGGSVGGGGSSGGGSSAEDYGIQPGMAVGSDGTVYNTTDFVPAPGQADKPGKLVKVTDEKQKELEALAAQKQALAQAGIEQAQTVQDSLLGKIKTGIVDGADKLKSIFSMNELQQFTPLMLNTIEEELNKFVELGVKNPITLRTLMMSNIAGGLFGKNQTFSDMQGNVIDPESVSINDETGKIMGMNEDGELVDVRYTREGMQDLMKERFGDDVFEALKRSAPDIGYTALGGYMPQTSGGLVDLGNKAVATKNPDGTYTTVDGRTISKDQGEAFNKMVFDARMELDRMNKDRSGNPQGGGQPQGFPGIPGIPGIPSLPVVPEPERPRYPLPGDPKRPPIRQPFMPDGGNFPLPLGINAFNPMFLGPSFRGSPYTNQGVSPAFYDALRRFA